MSRRGRHAADDASFAKSAGAAATRGLLLLIVAALIGFVLYRSVDDVPPGTDVASTAERTTTTSKASEDGGEVVGTTTVPLRAPKDVKVLVANGSGVGGLGGTVSARLRAPAGYNVLSPVNAPARVQATTIYYTPGFDREAAALAKTLGLPPTTVKPMPAQAPVPDNRGANVIVVAGPELNQAAATTTTAPRATAGSTTTTAAPRTTSTTAAD